MGAWGSGSFENDDALDWLDELLRSKVKLRTPLERIVRAPKGRYLEAPACSEAIAAAEVVAALLGRAGSLPERALAYAASHAGDATDDVRKMASEAVARIGASSELKELWDDTGGDRWKRALENLRVRLDAPQETS
jgi:hypothetical protein